jgi:hypothetical protein
MVRWSKFGAGLLKKKMLVASWMSVFKFLRPPDVLLKGGPVPWGNPHGNASRGYPVAFANCSSG